MEIDIITEKLQLSKTAKNFLDIATYHQDFFKKNNGKLIFTQDSDIDSHLPSSTMFYGYEKNFKSLFLNNKFMFIDKKIISDMSKNKKSIIGIDYSVSFDTQFSSFIERYFTNKRFNQEKVFEEILYKLVDNNINTDYTTYLLENISKGIDTNGIISNIEQIIRFFHLDTSSSILLKNMKVINNNSYANELSLILNSIVSRKYQVIYDDFKDKQKIMYIILMKIILINQSKKSTKYKVNQLIEFMQSELHTLYGRELIVASKFYENLNSKNDKVIFFNKVLNINEKTLERLKNMAWDFSLIRHLERAFTINPNEKSDYYIPYFLTFDNGLSQIMDLYPLKAIVYFASTKELRIIPDIDVIELANKYDLTAYFSEKSIKYRNIQRKGSITYYHNLIDNLEAEIKSFIQKE